MPVHTMLIPCSCPNPVTAVIAALAMLTGEYNLHTQEQPGWSSSCKVANLPSSWGALFAMNEQMRVARRATPDRPAAFPFSYMDPSKYVDVIDGYNVRNVSISRFAPVGAPLFSCCLERVRCTLVSGVAWCPWHRALPNRYMSKAYVCMRPSTCMPSHAWRAIVRRWSAAPELRH